MTRGFYIHAQQNGNGNGQAAPVEVLLYDFIHSSGCDVYGGVCADDIVRDLMPYRDREITLRINSPGGDVFAGLAVYNFLRPLNVTTVIDGLAASAASIVALAGRTVQMARNAFIMVHNPTALVIGEARDMRKMADQLDQTRDQLADIYSRESGQSVAATTNWMVEETWFTAEDALKNGLITGITEAPAVDANFDLSRFNHVPRPLRSRSHSFAGGKPVPGEVRNLQQETTMQATTDTNISACGCGGQKPAPTQSQVEDKTAALQRERDEAKAQVESLKGKLEVLAAKSVNDLKARAMTAVDAAIAEGRLPLALREPLIRAYVEDEADTLTKLAELKPAAHATKPVLGTAPLQVRNGPAIPDLRAMINAEPDPKKRIELMQQNWDALADRNSRTCAS